MVADPTAKRIKSRQTELGSTLLYPCWFRVFFIWNKLKGSVAMLTAWKGTVPRTARHLRQYGPVEKYEQIKRLKSMVERYLILIDATT